MRKLLALLLAALTVCACLSCADSTAPGAETTVPPVDTTASDIDPAANTTAGETGPVPSLPDVGDTYKGMKFVIATRPSGAANYPESWIWRDALIGNIVDDSVFRRNAALEEKYGITIEQVEFNDVSQEIRKTWSSQDDTYDLAMPRLNQVAGLMQSGQLHNLFDLPYNNYDAPWWNQRIVDGWTYMDQLYAACSDMSFTFSTSARGIHFNRDLINDHNLEDPYDLVANNQWTVSKFQEMTFRAEGDVNGNGQHDDEDIYGLLDSYNPHLFIAAGMERFKTDTEGNITFHGFNEKTMAILDAYQWLKSEDYVRDYDDVNPPNGEPIHAFGRSLFATGHFLFTQGAISRLASWTTEGMEDVYGIVPLPKLDSEQAEYYCFTDNNNGVITVPATNSFDDLPYISIILEDLSYTSSKIVYPAYIETTIKLRKAPEPEMAGMIDLIRSSLYADIGNILNINADEFISNAFITGRYASVFAGAERSLQNQIRNVLKQLDGLRNK